MTDRADQPPPEAELDIEVESLGSVALARLVAIPATASTTGTIDDQQD